MDLTAVSYEVIKYTLIYNLMLFLVWFVIVKYDGGHVGPIYYAFILLLVARLHGVFMGLHARALRSDSSEQEYFDYMTGLAWETRLTPETIAFIFLAVVLTRRFLMSYLFHDPEYRAKNGRRKDDKKRH